MPQREMLLSRVEILIKRLAQRTYRMRFDSLDDISLTELSEFLQSVLSRLDSRENVKDHIGNRCIYLCHERRADRDHSDELIMICGRDRPSDEPCRFDSDRDARQFCPDYNLDQ